MASAMAVLVFIDPVRVHHRLHLADARSLTADAEDPEHDGLHRSAQRDAASGTSTASAHAVLLISCSSSSIVSIFPYLYLLSTALRPRVGDLPLPAGWLPDTWAPENFVDVWTAVALGQVDPQQRDRLGRLDGRDPGAGDPRRLRAGPPEVPGPARIPPAPSGDADVLAGDPDHRPVPVHDIRGPDRHAAVAHPHLLRPVAWPSRRGSSRATTARCPWRSRRRPWWTVAPGWALLCG